MRWLLAILALVFPPAILVRRSRAAVVAGLLWVGGLAIFFLLAWGIGAILMLLAGLFAAVLALRT
jgi:hypothetical protein